MKSLATAAAFVAGGLTVAVASTSASALPAPGRDIVPWAGLMTDVQNVQWRYNRNCAWRGGRWVVDLGAGRLVICRPNRPGRDWVWRDDGPRHGWYHRRDRRWHHGEWNRRR